MQSQQERIKNRIKLFFEREKDEDIGVSFYMGTSAHLAQSRIKGGSSIESNLSELVHSWFVDVSNSNMISMPFFPAVNSLQVKKRLLNVLIPCNQITKTCFQTQYSFFPI